MDYLSLRQLLAFVKSRQDVYVGFAIWSAGSFSTSYELSVTPFPNGTDQSIWTKAGRSRRFGASLCNR